MDHSTRKPNASAKRRRLQGLWGLLAVTAISSVSASSQTTDILGWSDVRWSTTKTSALKTLQAFGARECNRTRESWCATAAGTDVLVIDKYTFNGVPFRVQLLFP